MRRRIRLLRKLLIATALSFTAATPIMAATAAKRDIPAIKKLVVLHGICVYGDPEQHDEKRVCAAADRLEKKLNARGYCLYGHGEVGSDVCHRVRAIAPNPPPRTSQRQRVGRSEILPNNPTVQWARLACVRM